MNKNLYIQYVLLLLGLFINFITTRKSQMWDCNFSKYSEIVPLGID